MFYSHPWIDEGDFLLKSLVDRLYSMLGVMVNLSAGEIWKRFGLGDYLFIIVTCNNDEF